MHKNSNYLYHALFWIVYTLVFAISEWGYSNSMEKAIIFELLFLPSRVIVVYFNWFFLIPRYIYNNKIVHYALNIMCFIVVVAILQRVFILYYGYPQFFPEWMEGQEIVIFRISGLAQNILIIFSPVAFTTGWKLFQDWKEKEKQSEALKLEKTETELKYLKSQINPHFLFNTLNNIYGLSLENSKKVPNLILKLSDFLSFSLYETNEKLIPLTKEIDLIKNFIDLQTSRFEDRVHVSMSFPNNIENLSIPPMIFIPFVENAFKHSLKNETQKASVDIELKLENNMIVFVVENSKQKMDDISTQKGGLGLINITRRLDLLYKENYVLQIIDDEKTYKIHLKINNQSGLKTE